MGIPDAPTTLFSAGCYFRVFLFFLWFCVKQDSYGRCVGVVVLTASHVPKENDEEDHGDR
jgi:hypothetical protein